MISDVTAALWPVVPTGSPVSRVAMMLSHLVALKFTVDVNEFAGGGGRAGCVIIIDLDCIVLTFFGGLSGWRRPLLIAVPIPYLP